jgi:hypothetical protein
MDRRAFLMSIAACLIPKIIQVTVPYIDYQPTLAQLRFYDASLHYETYIRWNQLFYINNPSSFGKIDGTLNEV